MEKEKSIKYNKLLCSIITVLALLIVQIFAGRVGWAVADLLPFKNFAFYKVYGRYSVHHIILMIIVLPIIAILSRLLKVDFGFNLGDRKKGMKYFTVYAAAFVIISLIYHILMYIKNDLPVYDFPLNAGNIMGTLGFQLLLTGTAEEILYRALPVTVLAYVFGKSVNSKGGITPEIIIASFLFSLAHAKWSLFPFNFEANHFQLFYAFALGTIQGIAYQDSRSILYPMLMHGTSNFLMVSTGYLFAMIK